MNPTLLYRIAAALLVPFAAGHTYGFLKFTPTSAEGRTAREAMNTVRMDIRSGSFTYGGFYRGVGLRVTAYLLFAAYVAWHLGTLARDQPAAIGALGWALTVVQAVCLSLSLRHVFVVPSLLSGIVLVCLGWASWLAGR